MDEQRQCISEVLAQILGPFQSIVNTIRDLSIPHISGFRGSRIQPWFYGYKYRHRRRYEHFRENLSAITSWCLKHDIEFKDRNNIWSFCKQPGFAGFCLSSGRLIYQINWKNLAEIQAVRKCIHKCKRPPKVKSPRAKIYDYEQLIVFLEYHWLKHIGKTNGV